MVRSSLPLSAVVLLVLFLSGCDSPPESPEEVLQQVEGKIASTDLLAYVGTYSRVDSTSNDPIYRSSASVSMKVMPDDSIFGAHLHIKGKDSGGDFDYFYDGQSSLELRHANEQIIMMYPHDYPNTPSNPGRTRTALATFSDLMITRDLSERLLQNTREVSLRIDDKDMVYRVILEYLPNEHEQTVTTALTIDQHSMDILAINKAVEWMGATTYYSIEMHNHRINDPAILEELYLTETYSEYNSRVFPPRRQESKTRYVHPLVGKQAPNFAHVTLDGEEISLNQFEGKIVVLDFWEPWCGGCLLAIPKINELQRRWPDQVQVLGIVSERIVQAKNLAERNNMAYPNLHTDMETLDTYSVSGRPNYFVLDKDLKVVSFTNQSEDLLIEIERMFSD